jgi:hypothetical protein
MEEIERGVILLFCPEHHTTLIILYLNIKKVARTKGDIVIMARAIKYNIFFDITILPKCRLHDNE